MEESYKYVRFIDGEIMYAAGIDTNISVRVTKCSNNIIDLLEVDDLVNIGYYSPRDGKRVSGLFQVESIIWDGSLISLKNYHMSFLILDYNFDSRDLEPVIESIITHEKLEDAKYDLTNKKSNSLIFKKN